MRVDFRVCIDFFFNWRLFTLQYCGSFCHTFIWISHGCTCVPHPDPLSHLPPHPMPWGHPSAPALSTLTHDFTAQMGPRGTSICFLPCWLPLGLFSLCGVSYFPEPAFLFSHAERVGRIGRAALTLPGASVHGSLQARILEWVAISSSRESCWRRDQTCVSCIGRRILYHCTT